MVSIRYVSPSETYEDGSYHRLKILRGHQLVAELRINPLAFSDGDVRGSEGGESP